MITPKARSAADIVVILFAAMVTLTCVIVGLGLVVARIMHPEANLHGGVELLTNILTTVVGALVGFIGGRATGRYEQQNGKEN